MTHTPKPELYLTGSSDGPTALPTLADLTKLYVRLTGKQPTAEDLAKAQAILDKDDAQK